MHWNDDCLTKNAIPSKLGIAFFSFKSNFKTPFSHISTIFTKLHHNVTVN